MKSRFNLSIFLLCFCLKSIYCTKGCVSLDNYSFGKIVSKFKAALIKFDTAYPYGKRQEEFEKVCAASKEIDDLVVGEVAVKDYGEKDNAFLAKLYGVTKDDYPAVRLFVSGRDEPLAFKAATEDDFNEENLKEFIRAKSGVYIGLQGCLEEFDKITEAFMNARTADKKRSILRDAEGLWDKAAGKSRQKSAEVYVKYMRKTLEVGDAFIENEETRVKNIIKGKLSKEKKGELEQKINILRTFKLRDEL